MAEGYQNTGSSEVATKTVLTIPTTASAGNSGRVAYWKDEHNKVTVVIQGFLPLSGNGLNLGLELPTAFRPHSDVCMPLVASVADNKFVGSVVITTVGDFRYWGDNNFSTAYALAMSGMMQYFV